MINLVRFKGKEIIPKKIQKIYQLKKKLKIN